MRVLMLGWEFPPHISGGLGTACLGITQGLARRGVEITFVVPRAHGDEDAAHLQLVGAGSVPVETAQAESPSAPALPPREPAELAEPAPAAQAARVRTLAIESLLAPYLDRGQYRARLVASERRAPEPAPPADQPAPRAHEAALRADAAPPHAAAPRRLLEFSGGYGADLFGEVARYAQAVAALAARERFDVIHAHDWMGVPAGIAARAASGKPLVFHVHACESDRAARHPDARVQAIEQLGLEQADRIVCVSHYTAGVLQRGYRVDPARIRVVHNALTQREQLLNVHVEKAIAEPIVLFLGRVTAQKGPGYFLEAAARVLRVRPDVRFVVAGSGDRLGETIELAARLGLARNVHFTGFLRGEEVERMYAMADVYVMPSVSEPFGIAPLEAMALDVPVIVSRQSGVAEVLRNALKVDYWDVQGLADKILAVLAYPALAKELQEEGRAEARSMRWDAPAGKLRELYAELGAGA